MTGSRSYWERYARTRTPRRRFLRGIAVAGAAGAAVSLARCGGGTKNQPAPISQAGCADPSVDVLNASCPPRAGGRYSTAAAANFGSFDPHIGIALASAYFPRIYNVLVNQSATRPEFVYFDLAESYELPEPDQYIFRIRPGVAIAPNELDVPERDLDGEDVRVSIERIRSERLANNYAFANSYISDVTAGDGVVTIRTPGPYAWFINRIGLFVNPIVPRELLNGNLDRLAMEAAGAGPFRLISVTEGESARFDRNPNYYRTDDANGGAPLPYVDGIDLKVILDRATLRTAFVSGQIDGYLASSGDEARSLKDAIVAREPAFGFISFTMNIERDPFRDPRVRRAFSRAINRQEYVDIVYGGDAEPNGLVHWPLGSYALPPDELAKYQPYDVDEARRLVSEAGGIRVRMMYPTNATIEEHNQHLPIFLKQMQDAGIEIEQEPQDFSTWVANYLGRNYQCSLALNQLYETPEIPLDFHSSSGPLGDRQGAIGLGDPEIEAAIARTKEIIGVEERVAAVHAAQRVLYEKEPMFLPLVSPYAYDVYRPRVRNVVSGIGTSKYIVSTFWLDDA